MEPTDSFQVTASQAVANEILIPCAIGWLAQIFLGGIACARCIPALRGNIAIPFARTLLTTAVVSNLVSVLNTAWAVTAYLVVQNRSTEELNSLKIPDVIALAPALFVTLSTQIFMAYRCWRIIGRSNLFVLVVGLGEMAVAGGMVWGIVANELYRRGQIDSEDIFAPTQVWIWGNVFVDLVITFVFIGNLVKLMKEEETTKRKNPLANSLIRLTFETCAAPLAISIFTGVLYCATWQDPIWWNLLGATLPWIPSVYLFSFVYCLEASNVRSLHLKRDHESAHTAPALAITLPGGAPGGHTITTGEISFFVTSNEGEKDGPYTDNRWEYMPSRQRDKELERSVMEDSVTASRLPDNHSSTWEPPNAWQSISYGEMEDKGKAVQTDGMTPSLKRIIKNASKRPSSQRSLSLSI